MDRVVDRVVDGEIDEQAVGGYRLRIDRSLCVGFGDCIEAAPGAFALDGEGVVVLHRREALDTARLLAACAACPVDALSVIDDAGRELAPCAPRHHAAPAPQE